MQLFGPLFNAIHLSQLGNKFIDLFGIRNYFSHGVSLETPFDPSWELGAVILNLKPSKLLKSKEPTGERDCYDVDEAKCLAAEEIVVTEDFL